MQRTGCHTHCVERCACHRVSGSSCSAKVTLAATMAMPCRAFLPRTALPQQPCPHLELSTWTSSLRPPESFHAGLKSCAWKKHVLLVCACGCLPGGGRAARGRGFVSPSLSLSLSLSLHITKTCSLHEGISLFMLLAMFLLLQRFHVTSV